MDSFEVRRGQIFDLGPEAAARRNAQSSYDQYLGDFLKRNGSERTGKYGQYENDNMTSLSFANHELFMSTFNIDKLEKQIAELEKAYEKDRLSGNSTGAEVTYKQQIKEAKDQLKEYQLDAQAAEEFLAMAKEQQAAENARGKAQAAGLNSMDWYDQTKAEYDDIQSQLDDLYEQRRTLIGGADAEDYSGWATDELSAASIGGRNKADLSDVEGQIIRLIYQQDEAAKQMGYANRFRWDDVDTSDPLAIAKGKAAYDVQHLEWMNALERNAAANPSVGEFGAFNSAFQTLSISKDYKEPTDKWTEQQKNTYYALLGSGSTERADEFAIDTNNWIQQQENQAKADKIGESATSSFGAGALHTVGSIGAGLLSGAEYLGDVTELAARGIITEKPFGFADYNNAVTSSISTFLNNKYGTLGEEAGFLAGKGWGDAYQIAQSVGQSWLAMGLTGGSSAAVNVMFFGQAAKQTLDEQLAKGSDPYKAVLMGTLSGTAEVLGETLSLENIKGLTSGQTKGLLKDILRSAGIEGSEEGMTTLLNTFADQLVNGSDSDYYVALESYISQGMSYADAERAAMKDWVNGIAFDMVAGAASGGISGGVGGPVSRAGNYLAEKFQANEGQKNTAPSQEAESTVINDNPALHTPEENKIIEDFKAAADENVISGIERARSLQNIDYRNKFTVTLSDAVGNRVVNLVKNITGLDITGFKNQIKGNAIAHIDKRHGANGTADHSMANIEDFGRINYVVENADSATLLTKGDVDSETWKLSREYRNADNTQAPLIRFEKKVDNTYYVVEAVPDSKANRMAVVSAYMEKAKKEVSSPKSVDAEKTAPRATPEASLEISETSNTSIPSSAQNVKEESSYLARSAAAFGPAANEVYNLYSPTQTAREYIAAMDAAINTVAANVGSRSAFEQADSVQYLTKEQRDLAWSEGQKQRAQAQEKDRGKQDKGKKKTPPRKGRVSYGGVSYEGRKFKATSADKVKPEVRRVLEKFSEATGVDIVFYESEADQRGDYVGANGFYRKGTVYLDVHAGAKSTSEKEAVLITAAHEFTHFIRENTPRRYNQLKEFVTEHLLENGYDFETLVERKIRAAQKDGGLSRDAAVEEVVADACEMVFADSKAVERLAKEKPGLAKRIADWLHEFFSDIRKAFEGVEARHEEAKAMLDYMDELTRLWDDALVEAAENRGGTKKAEENNPSFSLREFEDGRRFVDVTIDQEQFDGLTISEMNNKAKQIIKSKFGGKVVGIDNKAFVNGNSAEKYAYFTPGTDKSIIEAKARASTELDNLIDAGTNFRKAEDGADGHIHPDVVDGFSYFDTVFKVGNQYYSGTINIKNIGKGKLFWGVTKTKNITQDLYASYGKNPTSMFLRDVSMERIPQKEPNVNYSRRDSAEGLTKEEARAQAASYTRLKAENAELQRRVEYWKGQTRRTKQATVRQADVNRFARALVKNYSSTADQTYIRQALQEMGDYLVQNTGEALDYEQLRQMAVTVAAELVATAEVTEENGYTADVADDILSTLKNADIKLDRQYLNDLPEGFRKAYRGQLHIFTDKGRSVDSIYAELQEDYGYDLFPAIDNPADQLVMLGDIFDRLNAEPEVYNPFRGSENEATLSIANEIMDTMLGEDIRQTAPTMKDKADANVAAVKAEGKQKVDNLRTQKNDKIDRIHKEEVEKRQEVRAKERQRSGRSTIRSKQRKKNRWINCGQTRTPASRKSAVRKRSAGRRSGPRKRQRSGRNTIRSRPTTRICRRRQQRNAGRMPPSRNTVTGFSIRLTHWKHGSRRTRIKSTSRRR